MTELSLPVLVHIAAGAVGLLSGASALAVRKGKAVHRAAGTLFLISMSIMGSTGAIIAALEPDRLSLLAGILAVYLVTTSWVTVRRADGMIDAFETWAFCVAFAVSVSAMFLASVAAAGGEGGLDGNAPEPFVVFGSIAGLAALLDIVVINRGRIAGVHRIARHLWRMCAALAIAASAFFLGQPDYFPESVRGTWVVFTPPLAALGLMVFWLLRVWFTKTFKT